MRCVVSPSNPCDCDDDVDGSARETSTGREYFFPKSKFTFLPAASSTTVEGTGCRELSSRARASARRYRLRAFARARRPAVRYIVSYAVSVCIRFHARARVRVSVL